MSVDSFGYAVMSLRELLGELRAAAEADPVLLDRPVWTDADPRLYKPVLGVRTIKGAVMLAAEHG